MAPTNPQKSASNILSVTDFSYKPISGYLGHPLGEIMTISGIVQQAALGAKSTRRSLVLSITAVNDRPLPQPVTIEFNLFVTAQVSEPILGRSFKYIGYETGGFTGVPSAAFKYIPAVATTSHKFNTSFQVLHEELDIVKVKSDLMRFNDRRILMIGKYVSATRSAPAENTGIPGFKGTYTTAKILLEDGTEIPIFPTYMKQSLRSTEEAQAYEGKIVTAVGKIEIDRNRQLNPTQHSTFISIDGIWQYRPKF